MQKKRGNIKTKKKRRLNHAEGIGSDPEKIIQNFLKTQRSDP